jgi:hypothetical protein
MVNDVYEIDFKCNLRVRTGFIWHNVMGLSCEHGNESLGPKKGREFTD